MQGLKKSPFISLRCARKSAAMLGCVLLVSVQPVFAQPLAGFNQVEGAIVEHKQVEKVISGSYHYQSNYEMTKDQKGDYHSTYQSEKKEWFCCFHLFSSEKAVSIQSEKP